MSPGHSSVPEEWAGLARRWQSRTDPITLSIDRLLRYERRRRAGMVLLVGVEIAISVTALVVSWSFRERLGWAGLVAVVGWIVLIWSFALWNRRGTWRPEQETIEGFLRITRLRSERGLRSIRFAMTVVVAQVVLSVAWIAAVLARKGSAALGGALIGLGTSMAVAGGLLIWALWYRRVIQRRLERLENQDSGLRTQD